MKIREEEKIKKAMATKGFIAEMVEEVIPGKKYMVYGELKVKGWSVPGCETEQFDADVYIEGTEIRIFTQYGITTTRV